MNMKRVAIASHAKLAEGIKSTLELFVGTEFDITYICAYVDDYPSLDEQVASFLSKVKDDDQAIIFTDLYGGSVNQNITLAVKDRKNIFVIAGFNLPLVIETVLAPGELDFGKLKQIVASSQKAIQITNLDEKGADNPSKNKLPEKAEKADQVPFTGVLPTTIRVDERLIHGQIAMVWSRELNLHGIIVANDEVADNETQQMALKMAVPAGIKVLIRPVEEVGKILTDSRAQNKRLLVLVRTVKDALRLVEKVANIEMVNIGNVGKSVEGQKKTLSQFVMLTDSELEALAKLVALYPETALQNLPTDKKVLAKTLL